MQLCFGKSWGWLHGYGTYPACSPSVVRAKKNPAIKAGFSQLYAIGSLELDNIRRSRSFSSINNVEAYSLAFLERSEAFRLNSRVMYENIISTILLDKTKTFRIVKPFNCTFCHFTTPCWLCTPCTVLLRFSSEPVPTPPFHPDNGLKIGSIFYRQALRSSCVAKTAPAYRLSVLPFLSDRPETFPRPAKIIFLFPKIVETLLEDFLFRSFPDPAVGSSH